MEKGWELALPRPGELWPRLGQDGFLGSGWWMAGKSLPAGFTSRGKELCRPVSGVSSEQLSGLLANSGSLQARVPLHRPAFPLQLPRSSPAAGARGARGGVLGKARARSTSCVVPAGGGAAVGQKLTRRNGIFCMDVGRCPFTPGLFSHRQASALASPWALGAF